MLAECSRNVGWGFLEADCSTRADVAPGEITGSSFHHCLPFSVQRVHTHTHTAFHRSRHTFQRNILRGTPGEGRKFKGKFNPQLRSAGLPPTCTDGFIYFLQGFMFASLKLLPAAASWLEVKCYKIKYRVGNTPLKQRRTMSDPGAQLYILLLPFTPISTLSPGHPHLFPLCCAYTTDLVSRPFFFFFTKS